MAINNIGSAGAYEASFFESKPRTLSQDDKKRLQEENIKASKSNFNETKKTSATQQVLDSEAKKLISEQNIENTEQRVRELREQNKESEPYETSQIVNIIA